MFRKIFSNKFFKNVALIAGGTAFAQILNILLSPVITRLYSPEEYGVLTTYTAILGILALAALKYEMAIPLAKDDKQSINVLVMSLFVLISYVTIIFFILLLFGDPIFDIFNFDTINTYWYLVPLGVFLSGLYIVLKNWAFRIKDFKSISKTTMNQSLFSNLMKVGFGFWGIGEIGLILGTIVGQSFGIRVLSKPLFLKFKTLSNYISTNKVIESLKRYKNFPIYNAPNKLLISIGNQLPIIFLATFYGTRVVGFYGLAYTIVRLPMNLIGNSVGDVFFSEAAKIGKENPSTLKKLSIELIKKLIVVGLIPLFTLIFFGPFLFSFVFGENWYNAGVYSRIISIMLFFSLIFTPVSRVYEVFEKQKEKLLIDLVRITLIIIVFTIGWQFQISSYLTILLYSIIMSLIYCVTYIFAIRILNSAINKDK